MKHACALATLALSSIAVVSCNETPLAPRSIVVSPRVLAIITDPPEVRPGEIAAVRVLTGGTTMEPTFRWYACARPEATTTFTASSTFGQAEPNAGCFPDGGFGAIPLGEGRQVFFAVPADLLSQLDALAAIYGRSLSRESLERIARTVGITITLGVEMIHGSTVERAIKRIIVVNRERLNTNPLPPAFTLFVGGADAGSASYRMARSVDEEDRCVAFPNRPVRVAPGTRLELAPEPDEDRWLEMYDAYDSSGGITPLREEAFYSFYATAGSWSTDRTRPPIRNTTWRAPQSEAAVTLWTVVRDGRGGTSACSFEISVTRQP